MSHSHPGFCQSASPPAPASSLTDWDNLQSRVFNLLGKLATDVETLQMRFGINAGRTFLGSGSVSISRNGYSFLEAYSREASCRYLFYSGSGTCLLKTPSQSIIFRVGSSPQGPQKGPEDAKILENDVQVPSPSFKVTKGPDEGFQFDIQMNLASSPGRVPIVVYVHPDTSAYITKKLREKFPMVRSDMASDSFFASHGKEPGVILYRQGDQATGFDAWFDRNPAPPDSRNDSETGISSDQGKSLPSKDGGVPEEPKPANRPDGDVLAGLPPLHLEMKDFLVNVPIATPPIGWLSDGGRIPSGNIETVYRFTTGFYSLLSSFMPKEGE